MDPFSFLMRSQTFKNSSVELINPPSTPTPFFFSLIILITVRVKPLIYNFQKINGHLDLSSIRQNNIKQNKRSFNELQEMV